MLRENHVAPRYVVLSIGNQLKIHYPNSKKYEFEKDVKNLSYYGKRLACLTVLHSIIKNFEQGGTPKTVDRLVVDFGAPLRLIRQVIEMLVDGGLIAETEFEKELAYLPTLDIHKMDLSYVITKLGDCGSGDIRFNKNEPVAGLNRKLQLLRKELKFSKNNVLIKDI